MEKHSETCDELYECLLRLKTKEDCRLLLSDLCTFNEIEQMAGRVKAARLLLEGHTYSQIISQTEISSATLSRVSRCVSHGSGGYAKFVRRGDGNAND